MNNKKNQILKIIISTLLVLSMINISFGIGLGVSPSVLNYKKVLKNGFAQKTLLVSTDTQNNLTVFFEKSGDVADWISFGELDKNINNIVISSKNPYLLKVRVEPPNNIANGNYTGYIRIVTDSINDITTGKGSVIKAAFMVNVNLEIIGDEIVNCVAGAIDISNFEIGEKLFLNYIIENNGNVRVNPDVSITIFDNFNNKVSTIQTTTKSILPTLKENIKKSLTNNLKTGQYFATINIPLCNANKDVTFDVLQPGGISDNGELINIKNTVWSKTNKIIPITAVFKNTGERSVRAKFTGTIIDKNNQIVKIIDTDYLTVLSGDTQEFQTFFQPKKIGQYFIKGKVIYNDKRTFEKGSILNINEIGKETQNNSIIKYGYMIFFIIIIILILIIIKKKKLILKKKYKRRDHNKFKF